LRPLTQRVGLSSANDVPGAVPRKIINRGHAKADPARRVRERTELKDAILDYLDRHNANPKSTEIIFAKERRALEALEALKSG
jgi:hypothetical protein